MATNTQSLVWNKMPTSIFSIVRAKRGRKYSRLSRRRRVVPVEE